ncbi:AI-2E family transporter [Agromyces marinus]|uniref:AI-2E family transporter n=1 Tax=Agromyces marinus TaxID=1389020 RepID=A0ABM8H2B0_9MICO|nr:AI-2E family transporter [Agromyces marinus]UIP60027.1 Putative transport protein YhhT [Agromyces marinus]BDZ54863.1 AI-2E family transporter [Agromyces marinus]
MTTEREGRVSTHRNAFILIGIGGAVLATTGLAAIGSIVAPVFLALVLTICVHPLRVALERRGVPRGLATGSVITAVFLLLLGFGYAVLVAIGQFTELVPQFASEIEGWVSDAAAWLGSIGLNSAQLSDIAAGFDASSIVGFVGSLLGGVTGSISMLVVILTMLLLMAMDSAFLPTLLRQLQPHRPLVVTALAGYGSGVRRYMVVTTLLGLAQGLINWFVLVLLGVPGAFIWGLLSFLCSFIPNIGYFIAIVPPIFFGALVGGWPTVIAVVIVYGIVNAGVQSVVQPRVVGNAVALSQSLTFFSVLFWAVVLGPIGAILAIPLTLLVRMVLVDTNPSAGWIRPLLGDVGEAKAVMDAEDVDRKSERVARRAERRAGPG